MSIFCSLEIQKPRRQMRRSRCWPQKLLTGIFNYSHDNDNYNNSFVPPVFIDPKWDNKKWNVPNQLAASLWCKWKKKKKGLSKYFYVIFLSQTSVFWLFSFHHRLPARLNLPVEHREGSSCSCAFVCRCLGVNTDSGGPPRLFSALLKKHTLPFSSAPNEPLRSSRFFSKASQNCQKSGILWQDDAAILCHTILFISVFIFIISSSILQIHFLCEHVRGFQQHRSQNCPAPGVLAALFVVLPRATHPFDTGSTRQQQGHSCDSYPDWWFWSIALITVVQHVVHLSFLVGRRERETEGKKVMAGSDWTKFCLQSISDLSSRHSHRISSDSDSPWAAPLTIWYAGPQKSDRPPESVFWPKHSLQSNFQSPGPS